jgi:hypothetical protein
VSTWRNRPGAFPTDVSTRPSPNRTWPLPVDLSTRLNFPTSICLARSQSARLTFPRSGSPQSTRVFPYTSLFSKVVNITTSDMISEPSHPRLEIPNRKSLRSSKKYNESNAWDVWMEAANQEHIIIRCSPVACPNCKVYQQEFLAQSTSSLLWPWPSLFSLL